MSKEKGCQWHFCEDFDGYNYGAGVSPQKNFRKASVAASIVRESLQNSIDAAVSYPVIVKYTKKELDIEQYPSLFGLQECSDHKSLCDHFDGFVQSFNENDEENLSEYAIKAQYVRDLKTSSSTPRTIPYLRISDYNTSGMEYIPEQNKGTFASFVRSAGRNDKKSKGSAGSCGVGKGAYIQMSQFNTLIVSSRSDTQTLFEGYLLGVSHYVDETGYHPYAFYDNNNRKPVCDIENIPTEFIREEVGTDINIIGIDDEDWEKQEESMILAVLRHFWLAIHEEQLIIEIGNLVIDKSHLKDLLYKYFLDQPDGAQTRTYNPIPYYNIVLSEPSDKIIHIKATLDLIGSVEFYLNKAKTGNGRILYMRESRMLIFSKLEQLYNQINGVFVCTGKSGNEILKRAENESHTEWKARPGDEEAKKAIDIINDFIKECLKNEIGSVTKQTVDIKSLAGRLPISIDPVFDEEYDEDMDINENGGQVVTETVETTEASAIQPHKAKKEKVGKVHVRKKKEVSTDPIGGEFEETTEDGTETEVPSTYIPNDVIDKETPVDPPFSGPKPNVDLSSSALPNTETDGGEPKKTISINSFEPWAFARKVSDEYEYSVHIRCAKEHENANVVVTVGAELGEDHIDIKESSLGTPNGHIIQGVHLNKGITSFTFKFKDNEKVSVKLSAYEYKD